MKEETQVFEYENGVMLSMDHPGAPEFIDPAISYLTYDIANTMKKECCFKPNGLYRVEVKVFKIK